MKIAVWVVTALLALFFVFAGSAKAFAPWDVLEAGSMGIPVILLKIAGFAELVGAIGLVLPALTRVMPILTPIAAVGLVVTMIGATSINVALGLSAVALQTGIAGLLSAFVAWARFSGRATVTPRRPASRGAQTVR